MLTCLSSFIAFPPALAAPVDTFGRACRGFRMYKYLPLSSTRFSGGSNWLEARDERLDNDVVNKHPYLAFDSKVPDQSSGGSMCGTERIHPVPNLHVYKRLYTISSAVKLN